MRLKLDDKTLVLIDSELDEAPPGALELWPYPLQEEGRPALGQTVSWLLRSLAKIR